MRCRTALIAAGALLALVVPVAASAAAATASRAVASAGTVARSSSSGSIVTSSGHSGTHVVIAKNHPVTSVGGASPQALSNCTTALVDGYLLTTTCDFGSQPEISADTVAAASVPVVSTLDTTASTTQWPPAWVASSCTTDDLDGYLVITDC